MQTLPSSVHVVPDGVRQFFAVSLQVSLQSAPPVHGSPAWTLHVPPLQRSAPLQKRPSEQVWVLLVWVQPVAALQPSSVQTLPSSQLGGAPPTQLPFWQVSLVVQALPSSQSVPLGLFRSEQMPVAGLHVPAMWH